MTIRITSNLLSAVAAYAQQLYPDTAQVRRYTKVRDGEGGNRRTWLNQGPPVACRLSPVRGPAFENPEASSINETVQDWTITLPRGTDVANADRIVINSTRTFEVHGVIAPHSYEIERLVMAVELIE